MFGRVFGNATRSIVNVYGENSCLVAGGGLHLLNSVPKSLDNVIHRQISQVKRIEEKKNERLLVLRAVVTDCYQRMIKDQQQPKLDWNEVKQQINKEGLHFSPNFEFSLLSAFDSALPNDNESFAEIEPKLFQLIAEYVQQSPDVQINKIAATRLCLFLSSFPHMLNNEQIKLIRSVAEQISADNIHVSSIAIDIISSLANSSPENCRYALEIYPRFIETSFELKIQILNILIQALIRYRLKDEFYRFLMENHSLLTFDMEIVGNLLQFLSETRYSSSELLDIFRCLSQLMVPVDVKDQPQMENILHQLGYSDIDSNVSITKEGQCTRCGQQMSGLSREEFEQLRTNFRSIIFDKNDEYLIDNLPEYREQLEEFERKIKNKKKYDLIIDGLNVGYQRAATIVRDKTGLRTFAKINKVKNVDQTLTFVIQTNRVLETFDKTLLIGRDHMRKWDKINRLLRRSRNFGRFDHFYLLNKTRDDNYILYAAVQHPETRILSNDYFRDHREKFLDWYLYKQRHYNYNTTALNDDESLSSKSCEQTTRRNLYRLFNRWLRSRQIKVDSGNQLDYPNQFDICIQINDNCSSSSFPAFHIPIVVRKDIYDNDDHEIEWICAHKDKPR